MSYKRILTIQDISCVGQCSLTVALPILSACQMETCILPSAVLSTHTAGFSDFAVQDLTEQIPSIIAHWKKEGISFEAVYTGYLGSAAQISQVKEIFSTLLVEKGMKFVDPAMADHGKLYPAFDEKYVETMKGLCAEADVLLPNITEACFLTDTPYQEEYEAGYIRDLLEKLRRLGPKTIVLTGVCCSPQKTGVAVFEDGELFCYEHKKIPQICHGTGDIYASSFVGAYLNGKSAKEAARIAADYTVKCIEKTQDDPDHWYGVKFETALADLMKEVL